MTKGAVLRAAYAIAIAERQDECVMDIADRNSDVLVYETVEGRGAAGVNEVWGFCTHMDVLRVPVPALVSTKSETTEKGLYLSKLLEVVKDANRNFANTLPAMAQGIEVAAEVLEPKVVKGGKFQTSVLNILDMSGGELSNNSSETETEVSSPSLSLLRMWFLIRFVDCRGQGRCKIYICWQFSVADYCGCLSSSMRGDPHQEGNGYVYLSLRSGRCDERRYGQSRAEADRGVGCTECYGCIIW